ncbi:ATP-binding protein [Myxacorys almedinensis]|uniref:DUF815 domain-containing protein n=1 Tax=Myxacorys almedinensis A TaxID=2690445 RepID=A0A8J8CH14_9CYAN|nr:ATP-binding protein [Myxacorys almedinensis]NDJ16174.1 DUF815 domain-containing protein [Myxacorys almedinensis A]
MTEKTDLAPDLYTRCLSLLVYREVLHDEVGQAFLALLQAASGHDLHDQLQAYGRWFSAIAQTHQGWQDYVLERLLTVENSITRSLQTITPDGLPPALVDAIAHDLQILQQIYRCTSQQMGQWISPPMPIWADQLPTPPTTPRQAEMLRLGAYLATLPDWATAIPKLAAFYQTFGTGMIAQYLAFRWQTGHLVAIAHPDPIRVDALVGYETQRDTLIKNTEFLLAGLPALHILLYGSRGSGKSSLVKSLLRLHPNLRLIEVGKSELTDLSTIVEQLRDLPQKFIIFVDDLSFEEDNDAYKALKVVLEGNLTARPDNVVVYATSNRRHLIREFFDERPRPSDADEIHHWDTVQEKLSFSDRFGLTLTFEPADQQTYLTIVHHLAQQANLSLKAEELEFQALQWATRHNGRSGRTARQFIDFLKADLALS